MYGGETFYSLFFSKLILKIGPASMAFYDRTAEIHTDLRTRTSVRLRRPSLYRVVMLNDDYTPMDFVVHILQTYFGKTLEDATKIMLDIHTKGSGICGVYTLEIAETKVAQVRRVVQKHQHPLQCMIERE
jgi:ATP-dependent Clp protease adaptor protein ClpS